MSADAASVAAVSGDGAASSSTQGVPRAAVMVSAAKPAGRAPLSTHARDGSGVQHRLLKKGQAWGRRLKNTQGAWSRLRTEATNDQVSVSKHDDNGRYEVAKFCTHCGSSTQHSANCVNREGVSKSGGEINPLPSTQPV